MPRALEGAKQTLVIHAPFDGTVVYRDLSPQSADERHPVLAVSRQDGCRLRVRLPAAQAAALQQAGEVPIELTEPAVEPYFAGRFLNATVLRHKPRYAVAELTCQPPPETVQELVEGEKVLSRLRWRPPLLTLLPYRAGIALAILGAAAWLVTNSRLRRQRIPREHASQDVTLTPSPPSRPRSARPVVVPEVADRSAARRQPASQSWKRGRWPASTNCWERNCGVAARPRAGRGADRGFGMGPGPPSGAGGPPTPCRLALR